MTDPIADATRRLLDAQRDALDAQIHHANAVASAQRDLMQARAALDDPPSARADSAHG